ncbi:MAG TPA: NAD-dependent epimerase/dehydratase family protein [Amnibacterium sp.]
MLQFDEAPLRVLYIGGTGTISASCVRTSVAAGMRVDVLNRGRNRAERTLPDGVGAISADVSDPAALEQALDGRTYDAVVNFLSYDADDALRMVGLFGERAKQYVHISSGSIYAKPVQQVPITESTPVAPNAALEYAQAKLRAEEALLAAHRATGFPVTIVRPSHTYDDANPPLPGGWTVVDRMLAGKEIPVHGDGTSLWTLTHAEDFAQGLVGLLGNPRTIGEVFNITGSDVYTWDQIYTIVADAFGTEAKLVHVASEMFPLVAPDWFWSGETVGDIGHSAVFDTTKLRTAVPGFAPRLTFHRAAARMAAWRAAHPASTAGDAATDEVLDRIVTAYHAAAEVFAAHAPQAVAS